MPGTSFDIIELYIVIQLNAILQATADVTPQLNQAIIILFLSVPLFVNWQFHKAHPYCFALPSSGMSK